MRAAWRAQRNFSLPLPNHALRRWNEPAAGKAAAKGRAKPAAAAKDSKKGKVVAPKKKPVAAKRPAKPAAKPAKPAVKPVKPAVKSAVKSAAKPAGGRKR